MARRVVRKKLAAKSNKGVTCMCGIAGLETPEDIVAHFQSEHPERIARKPAKRVVKRSAPTKKGTK
jgi:hypothetical protein